MAERFLELNSGKITTNEALTSSAGAGDAGKIIGLDAAGKLDASFMPVGIGPDVVNVVTSENLTSGDYVNLYDNAGTMTARKADNSNGRQCHGFVKDSVTSPAAVNVYFEGPNDNRSGLTLGARIYLGVTGGIIETPLDPAVDTGKIHQYLGVAVSATSVNTDIEDIIQL